MNKNQQDSKWSERLQQEAAEETNVILVDADYLDNVALNLIVNFERMLERQIPNGSLATWADCVALDGGLLPGKNSLKVVLIHSKHKKKLEHLEPSDFEAELSGKAFKDDIGEFLFECYPAEEEFVAYDDFFVEVLQTIITQKGVERVMVVSNTENAIIYNKVRATLKDADEGKTITVFSMQPIADRQMNGRNIRQEILGYSLMAALGIKSEEIDKNIK